MEFDNAKRKLQDLKNLYAKLFEVVKKSVCNDRTNTSAGALGGNIQEGSNDESLTNVYQINCASIVHVSGSGNATETFPKDVSVVGNKPMEKSNFKSIVEVSHCRDLSNRLSVVEYQQMDRSVGASIVDVGDNRNVLAMEKFVTGDQEMNKSVCGFIANVKDHDRTSRHLPNGLGVVVNEQMEAPAFGSIIDVNSRNMVSKQLSSGSSVVGYQLMDTLVGASIVDVGDNRNVLAMEKFVTGDQEMNKSVCGFIANVKDHDRTSRHLPNGLGVVVNEQMEAPAFGSIIDVNSRNMVSKQLSSGSSVVGYQLMDTLVGASIVDVGDNRNVLAMEKFVTGDQEMNKSVCGFIANVKDHDRTSRHLPNGLGVVVNEQMEAPAFGSIIDVNSRNMVSKQLSSGSSVVGYQLMDTLVGASIVDVGDNRNVLAMEKFVTGDQEMNKSVCGFIANVKDHDRTSRHLPNGLGVVVNEQMEAPAFGSIIDVNSRNMVSKQLSSGSSVVGYQLMDTLVGASIVDVGDNRNVLAMEKFVTGDQEMNKSVCGFIANVKDHDRTSRHLPNGLGVVVNEQMEAPAFGSIIDVNSRNMVSKQLSSGSSVVGYQLMDTLVGASIVDVGDNRNVGSHALNTAFSNDDLSQLDINQMEFIFEDDASTLEGFEVLMDIDLNLENPMHILDYSIVDHTNQLPSSAQEKVQTNIHSKSIYENFMFGNDDVDLDTQKNSTLVTDSVESLPILPNQLLTNVHCSRRSCDDNEMVVPTSNESKKLKRLFCTFCKKTVCSLARHLTNVHKKEVEVKRLSNLPKGSKQRLNLLAKLKNRGLFQHNGDKKYNDNVFIPCRRTNMNRPRLASGFTTCAKCLGPYSKKSIRAHFKRCDAIDVDLNGERAVLVLGRMAEGRVHEETCDALKDIIAHMTEDHVIRLVRYDWLIIRYANALCDANVEVFQSVVISGKLRLAGRLLSLLKSIEPEVTDFASLYRPKFYDSLIKAIRLIGKFDPVKKYYGSPSTSKAAVTLIRAVGARLVAEYIQIEDVEKQTRTENFIKLFNCGVTTSVSKGVYRTQTKMKRDKREKLPTTEDIKLLALYIKKELKAAYLELSHKYSYTIYLKLARMTMASIIVFNRRRTGETQNILTSDYDRREYLEDQWLSTLSADDQKMAKQYSRMKIRGKLDRTVPCLIKPDVDKSIQLLLQHRENAKISDDNEFLFGLPTSVTGRIRRINACNVLRKISLLCGAKEPDTLRGTKMRKHIASMCISLELSEPAVGEVAEFMGHHDKVHYKYYRKMPIVREIVKMSQLLRTAQGDDEDDDGEISEDEVQDDPDGDHEDWPAPVDVGATEEPIIGATEEPIIGATEEPIIGATEEPIIGATEEPITGTTEEPIVGATERISENRPDQDVGFIEAAAYVETSKEKKKINKIKWSQEEIVAAKKLFLADMKVPSLAVIDVRRDEILKTRTSRQIKAWLYNQNKKNPTNV